MEATELPKAVAEGYDPAPFFFRDEYQPGAARWVAWSGSAERLSDLFYRVIGAFPDEVDVLFKVRRWAQGEPGEERWQRYHGECSLTALVDVVGEHEGMVFRDGDIQLCVMCGGGGDYLVVDDHGLFFLYTEDDGFAALCRKLGLEERREALLGQQPHWHASSDVFEQEQEQFITRLELQAVEASSSS
jgi:hypothetical protein